MDNRQKIIEARALLLSIGATVGHLPHFADLRRLAAVFGPQPVRAAHGLIGTLPNALTGSIETRDVWQLAGLPYPTERTQADNRAVGKKMKAYGWERRIILKSGEVPYPVYQKGTEEERRTKIYVFEDPVTRNVEVRAIPADQWPTVGGPVSTIPLGDLIRMLPPLD